MAYYIELPYRIRVHIVIIEVKKNIDRIYAAQLEGEHHIIVRMLGNSNGGCFNTKLPRYNANILYANTRNI